MTIALAQYRIPNATIEPAQCMDVCWHCHCHCRLYAHPPPFPVHAYVLVPVIGTGTGTTTQHITSHYVTNKNSLTSHASQHQYLT